MKVVGHFETYRYNPPMRNSPYSFLAISSISCSLLLLLSACNSAKDEQSAFASAVAIAATSLVQTEEARPSNTSTITPSQTSSPTPIPSQTASATPSPTSAPTLGASNIYLNVYVLPSNSDGPVGCGENLVALSTGVLPTGDLVTDVRVALERLFSLRVQYQYNTYNPLYSSSLIITSVQFEDEFGEIVVRTTGNLNRGEKGCDWDRIRLMVRATTRAASGGQSVEVRFNQHAFNDYVSSDR